MKKKFPIRTFALMITATVMLIFMMGSAFAQVQISNDCPDKCESSTFYTKGVWDEKARVCLYQTISCEYGCKIGITPECKEFPDIPPTDVAEYEETLWKMQRWMYEEKSKEVSMDIHGTEYMAGEDGKVFLQLLDDDKQAITNASCFSSVYYPNTTLWINRSLMSYVDEGLHFLDMTVPEPLGVYMVSAYCTIPTVMNITAQDDFESGDFSGGSGWNAVWVETGNCDVTSADDPRGSYHLRGSRPGEDDNDCYAYRSFNNTACSTGYLTFWAKAYSLESGDDCNYQYYDGSSYNTVLVLDDGDDDDTYRYYSYEVCSAYGVSSDARVRFFTDVSSESNDDCFIDDIIFYYVVDFNVTEYQFVRGSGELHVSDIPYETYMTFSTMPEPILESNHDYCIDNTTLGKTLIWEVCIDNKCDNVARNETITCNYGCYNDACNPEPIDKFIMMLIFLFVVVIVIVVIALAYNKWG